MNKLHILLLAFSAMTSAKLWADEPTLQGSTLQTPESQNPELTKTSEVKESALKKLMTLLAKAKQQQTSGPVAPALQAVAPAQTVSSGQDLVSLVKVQSLSFKDALEKMGLNVNKRFAKKLNGKKGQKLFLNKIKKEGLSWQAAAASLKAAAPAETAPSANTTLPNDPFSDFENYINTTYTTDNAGPLMSALLNNWQSIVGDWSNTDLLEAFANSVLAMQDQISGSVFSAFKTKYTSILGDSALNNLVDFQKALFLKNSSDLTSLAPSVVSSVFDVIKNNQDDLSTQLKATLKNNFQKAYRLVESSLNRSDFDNADSASTKANMTTPTATTAAAYTGLTSTGDIKALALKSLQEALDFTMTRQGLGRLIYGKKALTSMSLYSGKGEAAAGTTPATLLFADPNIQWACTVVNGSTTTVSNDRLNQEVNFIDSLITAPAYLGDMITPAGTDTLDKKLGAYSTATPTAAEVLKNQGFTLKLLAAASDDSIADHYELTPAEKTGVYCLRQLLNGKPLPTLRGNGVFNNPASENDDNLEGRNNRMQEENRSESRSVRGRNNNDIVWGN